MSERKYAHMYDNLDLESGEMNSHYPEVIHELLRKCPVAHSQQAGGFWFITKYDDVRNLAQRPRDFSSAERGVFLHELEGVRRQTLEEMDPPIHTKWRKLVAPYFGPNTVANYRQGIEDVCDELLDGIVAKGKCDIVPDFTGPLPGRVFFREVLGMPEEQQPVMAAIAHRAMHGPPDERPAAWTELGELVEQFMRDRQQSEPRGDVVDAVLAADFGGDADSWEDKLSCLTTLTAGGLNTTTGVLTGGLYHFAKHPDVATQVLGDPAVMTAAVEEILRLYNPAIALGRTALVDTTVGGRNVQAGERLFLGYGAASRDPDVFDDPDTFRLDRVANAHVTFGAGPHRCPGAHLVRLELGIVFERTLRRLPGLRLDGAPRFDTSQLRTIQSLPLTWDTPYGTQ